jgi:hypothetical protein
MTTTRLVTKALGLAVFAATLAPLAIAGCGEVPGKQAAFTGRQPGLYLIQAAYRPAWLAAVSDQDNDRDGIVGMWRVKFVSQGNLSHTPPIPDGAPIDFGYSQWHSDGTEILNSGSRPPATQNFCLGVWKRTGFATYKLNHLALSYDLSGALNGSATIGEQVTLDHTGNNYTGTFTIDVYDTGGNHVDHIGGVITGQRITAD